MRRSFVGFNDRPVSEVLRKAVGEKRYTTSGVERKSVVGDWQFAWTTALGLSLFTVNTFLL
jgi:hypothetical protein